MGTGIDHSCGRTSSTGGNTLSAQACFCSVPVTSIVPIQPPAGSVAW